MRIHAGLAALTLAALAGLAEGHLSPPVTFWSDDQAVREMTGGAARYLARDVRLSAAQRADIHRRHGWNPDEPAYRFLVARSADGTLLGAVVFLTEGTLHGPLRVAVALDPTGAVRDARIVQATEEAAGWARTLNERRFGRRYAGRRADGDFTVPAAGSGADMVTHCEQVAARQIQRAAVLFEAGGLRTTKGE